MQKQKNKRFSRLTEINLYLCTNFKFSDNSELNFCILKVDKLKFSILSKVAKELLKVLVLPIEQNV